MGVELGTARHGGSAQGPGQPGRRRRNRHTSLKIFEFGIRHLPVTVIIHGIEIRRDEVEFDAGQLLEFAARQPAAVVHVGLPELDGKIVLGPDQVTPVLLNGRLAVAVGIDGVEIVPDLQ